MIGPGRSQGKLVVKGIVTPEDAELALQLGSDRHIVSNHGGRRLDAGYSTIRSLTALQREFGSRITLMLDSGVCSGSDVACALASGANFVFMGRRFMYGVGARGPRGGDHTLIMLKRQLRQIIEQIGCVRVADLSKHLLPFRECPTMAPRRTATTSPKRACATPFISVVRRLDTQLESPQTGV